MKKYLTSTLIFLTVIVNGQAIKLTDNLIYPRLDSTFWETDFNLLNSKSSTVANHCQTCVYKETDSTRGRFCFNTTLGHVQLDTTLHNFPTEKLIGQWTVVNFGTFEMADSLLVDSKIYYENRKF